MHGAGNDFVVVTGDSHDWTALAPRLCDRHFGVGSDGILVAMPSAVADVRMRMFNPDGTEDECGNGLRCLALYARRRGLVISDTFAVETISGVKRVTVTDEGTLAGVVTAEMGRARLDAEHVPAVGLGAQALGVPLSVGGEELVVWSFSTGTAHTVVFGIPNEERFRRLSPLLEHHPAFPERTSIMWTEVASPSSARVRIWERGAGETLACGTGACAVGVASHLAGRTGSRIEVASRGGTLTVEVSPQLDLQMTGPAAFVFEGSWG